MRQRYSLAHTFECEYYPTVSVADETSQESDASFKVCLNREQTSLKSLR